MPGISLRPTLLLGGLVLACAPGLVHGQGRDAPYRILDPHPTRVADPEPVEYRFVVMGDHAYYAGWGDLVGVELFRAALSSANVELVCDVYPGAMGSRPYGLTVMGNRLYFFAGDAAHGFELWVSDGSVAGTRMVVDLYPGVASSLVPGTRAPAPIGVLGGQLLFGAETGDGQYSLWRSDGSVSGTRRLAHLGAAGARTPLLQFQAAGAFACFVVPDASISGVTVWRTDGLGSGTWPILALPDSSPAVGEVCSLSAAGDQIYVTNRGGLWRVDASAQSAEQRPQSPAAQ